MTLGTLIGRSLRFYWRTHLGTVAGVALAAAILTGALVVGGSVRFTLEQLAIARIGLVTQALSMPEHFFRSRLADDLSSEIHSPVAPVLQARGSVVLPDGRARANDVQVLGVDDRFWQLGRAQNYGGLKGGVISARLAEQLGVRAGDTIIVRVEMPAAVSRDAPMSGNSDASVALRIRLTAVAGDKEFGRFSLRANQVPPCTVFVPLALLQDQLKHEAQANMLLTSAAADANPALRKVWTLADAGLELHDNPLELRSDRVFLNPAITKPLISAGGVGVLTYFANEFRHGAKTTPYSFIAAVGSDQGNDEITISSWLADDLGAQAGDELVLRYYVIGERRELVERDATFRVRAITPIAKDDSWMPAFPGLADARSCREWDPGIPIDTGRIRQKDEDYWNGFRGTPKAFVTLAAGQKLWANRFGNLTAIRFPAGTDVAAIIHSKIDPAALGFFFSPVSEPAMNSSRGAMDFGQLFLGFSLFLIVAAIILTAMLVQLAQRTAESALLRTLGFPLSKIRRLILGEGLAIALVGTGLGVLGGVVYTKLALLGLSTLWRGAVGAAHFRYHAEPWTLALGAGASLAVSVLTVWLVQRRQMRNVPADLLAAGRARRPPRWAMGLVIGSCVVALALLPLKNAEAFFSAGAFLLISGIAFSYWWIIRLADPELSSAFGLWQLSLRGAARRPGRSLTTISTLASGVFLVISTSAFHLDARSDAPGTGGFALIAQSSLPIYDDINSDTGRRIFGISEQTLNSTRIVPLRVHDGDDASCLNLNRTRQPRLLGVATDEFERRHAFGGHWDLLDRPLPDGAVPAIGDEQTVVWALGKNLGESLSVTDEQGQPFLIRIVGILPSSILQGSIVMSEKLFLEKYPSTAGYREFLVDAPQAHAGDVAAEMTRGFQNRGMEVVPAWRRLAELQAVENTYLGIFQSLGALGLLLGSVGLGIAVMRNSLERRSELALLQAVGFDHAALQRIVLREHGLLIFLGLLVGLVSATVAVLPTGIPNVPIGLLSITLAGLGAGGCAWCWIATWLALRRPLLLALRNE